MNDQERDEAELDAGVEEGREREVPHRPVGPEQPQRHERPPETQPRRRHAVRIPPGARRLHDDEERERRNHLTSSAVCQPKASTIGGTRRPARVPPSGTPIWRMERMRLSCPGRVRGTMRWVATGAVAP